MERAAVLATMFVVGLLAAAAAAAQRPLPPPGTEPVIEKLRDNLYVVTTGGPTRTNVTFFITENNGVVMFDTGNPGWSSVWRAALKKITDKPLTHVFITHDHADHTGSLREMGDPLVRVAHENTTRSLAQAQCVERTGCQLFQGDDAKYLPTTTFKRTRTMFAGKDRVKAYNFGASHTNGDAVFEIPSLGAIVIGDLLAWRGVPRVMVDDSGSALKYPQMLDQLTRTIVGANTVITGHSVTMTWQDLLEFRSFVADFTNYVRDAHDAGKSVNDAMAGLSARLAKYKPCDPKVSLAAELQAIDCRFRTDYAALNAAILYDEFEGRQSTHGSSATGR